MLQAGQSSGYFGGAGGGRGGGGRDSHKNLKPAEMWSQ